MADVDFLQRRDINRVMNRLAVFGGLSNGWSFDYAANLLRGNVGELPADHGAIGDGLADDTVALQAAFDAAGTSGGVILLKAGAVYRTTAELRLPSAAGYVYLYGQGASIQCQATGPCNSTLRAENVVAIVRDLHINSWRSADYGVYLADASTSSFENVDVYEPLIDGFHLNHNNDRCIFKNCNARVVGRIFHTSGWAGPGPAVIRTLVAGTCTVTPGYSPVITFVGAPDLTTLGIRAGDMISVDPTSPGSANSNYLQIYNVDSPTQISCMIGPAATGGAGLKFSIHIGNGYHEGPGRADNNINRIDTFLGENCAGSAMKLNGLYGARVSNIQSNASNAYPVVVGFGPGVPTIGTSFNGCYFELDAPQGSILCACAAGITIDTVNTAGPAAVASVPGHSWGTITNAQNAGDPGRIDPIEGTSVSYIPSAVIVANALARGTINGLNYPQNGPGGSSLTMKDNVPASWRATSGVGAYGADSHSVGFEFVATNAMTTGGSKLLRLVNGATEQFVVRPDGSQEIQGHRIAWAAAEPTTGTWLQGDVVYNTTPIAGGSIGWSCVAPGTAGTYTEGRTATTDGTTAVVLSGFSTVLAIGDYLTINATPVRIVSTTGSALVVSSPVPAGAGLAITYTSAPTFKPFGLISA